MDNVAWTPASAAIAALMVKVLLNLILDLFMIKFNFISHFKPKIYIKNQKICFRHAMTHITNSL